MFSRTSSLISAVAMVLVYTIAPAKAAPSPDEISKEINLTVSAATAVIGDLQAKINGARVTAPEAENSALRKAFQEQFKKLSGVDFETASDPEIDNIRKILSYAFDKVTDQFRPDMLKGGQDALVPAFFRAQLLDLFNERAKGKYQAVTTMRTSELINKDSAPEKVLTNQAALVFIKALLEKGDPEPQGKAIDGKFVGYWPMKIAESCAACHLRNGLEQKVGAFGGATIVVVENAR